MFDVSWLLMMLGSLCVLWLYRSEQYCVHMSVMSFSSVRKKPFLSWIVVSSESFCCVRSLLILYAFLLLFFPRFSSISLHNFSIRFFLVLFMSFLICLLTFLYSFAPVVFLTFFTFLLLSQCQGSSLWPRVALCDSACLVPLLLLSSSLCWNRRLMFQHLHQ